jgi:hypothetical protein
MDVVVMFDNDNDEGSVNCSVVPEICTGFGNELLLVNCAYTLIVYVVPCVRPVRVILVPLIALENVLVTGAVYA